MKRPGISDAVCLGVLLLTSLAGAGLQPQFWDFWLELPLLFEVPLLCTTLLLLLSRSDVAAGIAAAIHAAILVMSGLSLLLSLFLLITVLFAGESVILGPFSVLLACNSVYTLSLILPGRKHVAAPKVSTS